MATLDDSIDCDARANVSTWLDRRPVARVSAD